MTVADSLGHTDRVHFIFNQGGTGPNIALTGTSGKDVIFATGHADTLTGGASADQFVFTPETSRAPIRSRISSRARTISISGVFSLVDSSTILVAGLAPMRATSGADTLITLNNGDSITLKNVALASLHASDFIVSPHH